MKTTILLGLALCLVLAGPALATNWIVPVHFPTIQDAIDNAFPGDVIWVSPGTYVENLDFQGKAITVRSFMGSEFQPGIVPGLHDTILEGAGGASVVTFDSGEGNDSVLQGFTIQNGTGSIPLGLGEVYGGGILCVNASPTILGNVVRNNTAIYGGGIACLVNAKPHVVSTLIHDNFADMGGGMYLDGVSIAIVTNNTITSNIATTSGGGMYFANSSDATVTNSILWDNTAPTTPEIALLLSTPTITYCDIAGGWMGFGNIDLDPLFFDPALDDFGIDDLSPCYNTGYLFAMGIPLTDYEGDTRTGFGSAFTGTPDIGADEYFFITTAAWTEPPVIGSFGSGWLRIWSGQPGDACLFMFSFGVLPAAWPTQFGDFWLAPAVIIPPTVTGVYDVTLFFPASGTIDVFFTVPDLTQAPPLTVYMQVITEGTYQLSGVSQLLLP